MCGSSFETLNLYFSGSVILYFIVFKEDFDRKLSVFINILLKGKYWNRALR